MTQLIAGGNVTLGGYYIDPLSVGLENIDSKELMLSMFPIPASESLNVNFTIKEQAHLFYTVTNTMGQIVYTADDGIRSPGSIQGKIDVSKMPDGIYFLNIHTSNITNTSKFLVSK
jgi:hypothetical protein